VNVSIEIHHKRINGDTILLMKLGGELDKVRVLLKSGLLVESVLMKLSYQQHSKEIDHAIGRIR
jgi:hypothetical protein